MIEKPELYDIYGLSGTPFWRTYYFFGAVSIFLLGVFLLGVYIVIRAYRTRTPKPIPYWECAYAELHQLHAQASFLGNSKKIFYTQLTRILKSYLSHHYNESYQGKTDQEVSRYLSQYSAVLPPGVQVVALFNEATPVKFARSYDKKLEMVKDVQRAILFVKKTSPASFR